MGPYPSLSFIITCSNWSSMWWDASQAITDANDDVRPLGNRSACYAMVLDLPTLQTYKTVSCIKCPKCPLQTFSYFAYQTQFAILSAWLAGLSGGFWGRQPIDVINGTLSLSATEHWAEFGWSVNYLLLGARLMCFTSPV